MTTTVFCFQIILQILSFVVNKTVNKYSYDNLYSPEYETSSK